SRQLEHSRVPVVRACASTSFGSSGTLARLSIAFSGKHLPCDIGNTSVSIIFCSNTTADTCWRTVFLYQPPALRPVRTICPHLALRGLKRDGHLLPLRQR
ncbi:hypothetical protein DOTSEDRAFT_44763, partial [Dothistroma septosporum NZE10]